MKTPKYIGLLILTLLTIVCVWSVFRKDEPSCDVSSFIVDENTLLQSGYSDMGPIWLTEEDRLGSEKAYRIFIEQDGYTAHHTIYEYRNTYVAQLHFVLEKEVFFPSGWQWRKLDESEALNADAWQIQCGESSDPYLGNRCAAVLRYGKYISHLSSSMAKNFRSPQDFLDIIREFDTKFISCD